MPKLGSTKRRDLVRGLRAAGFDGPYRGGNHSFMKRRALKVYIPSTDVGVNLLRRILKQAGITEEEWENLR